MKDTRMTSSDHDKRLEALIARIPSERMQSAISWLRRPSSLLARWIAGILLIFGGLLSILPILGLWMLPLGIVLLSDDVPPLRWLTGRALDWIERHRPHWLEPGNDMPGNDMVDVNRSGSADLQRNTS